MKESRNPKFPPYKLIESNADFEPICAQLATADQFAFDAEFVAEDGYTSEACLIQIATKSDIFLVDPLAGVSLTPFWNLVADFNIEKVVHAGLEDLAMCLHDSGQVPCNIFDVQIAAGLVGQDFPISLQRLVRSTVGIRLKKTQTLTDWRRRPLTEEQFRYGADDVAYLLPIADRLKGRLARKNRIEWANEEFARFEDRELYVRADRDLFWRIKGVGSLDGKGLAIAREVAIEREALAKDYDRPPRVLLKDHLMIAIAKHAISSVDKLLALRGLNMRSQAVRRIAAAAKRGIDTPPDARPKVQAVDDDSIQETTLRKLVSAVLSDYCHTEGIAVQLLATNRDIRALVLSHTRGGMPLKPGSLQRGWRKHSIGAMIDDVLSGRRSVRVVNGTDGPHLKIV